MTSRPYIGGSVGRESERGAALVVALMATMLLSALGLALILTTTTETKITGNYTYSQERSMRPMGRSTDRAGLADCAGLERHAVGSAALGVRRWIAEWVADASKRRRYRLGRSDEHDQLAAS